MAKIKIEVSRCDDFKCPYLVEEQVYSPDPFEGSYYWARCKHPDAPPVPENSLGSDDEYGYCEIPEWCPFRVID